MKKVFGMLFLLVSVHASVQAQEVEVLTNDEVPFVYESRAKIPTSDERLALLVSSDYRNARDEFTRQELMEQIKPIIKLKLMEARANSEYLLRIGIELGQYNFTQKAFPSGFTPNTFIPFNADYGLIFNNTKDIESVPVPLEAAKALSSQLQNSRSVTAMVYCRIVNTQEKRIGWRGDTKVLIAHVTRVDFLSNDDSLIATINAH
jgi:hypothetical protein